MSEKENGVLGPKEKKRKESCVISSSIQQIRHAEEVSMREQKVANFYVNGTAYQVCLLPRQVERK